MRAGRLHAFIRAVATAAAVVLIAAKPEAAPAAPVSAQPGPAPQAVEAPAAPAPPPGLIAVLDDGRRLVRLTPPDGTRAWPFDVERSLAVPPGFHVTVFASGLERPRFMAFDPDGVLYATLPHSGRVVAMPDADSDGRADRVVVFASGLNRSHGVAFIGPVMYVASVDRLLSLEDTDSDLEADRTFTVSTDLPGTGGHWTRTVVDGPGGRLYLSAGSSCNACEESDFRRASVLWFDPAAAAEGGTRGARAYPFATGLRNTVGLAFHPDTGELWGVDNGRDWLGDDLPPEELNRIVAEGDYGWPYCYGDRVPDPKLGSVERCAATVRPVLKMQAHSAPLGISFGRGLDFPPPYTDGLFVAFHGSWNRKAPTGYKVVFVPFKDGSPSGAPVDFITGWQATGKKDGDTWGRPVGVAVGPGGALYLSDDLGGVIYRVTYDRQE